MVKEVSEMYNSEVLGVDTCNVSWEYLMKKHLILDVLKCPPYGLFSEGDIACLKGRVNEKCNC